MSARLLPPDDGPLPATVPLRIDPPPQAPAPGYAAPLPAGTVLKGWRIAGVVGQGGFGVVYRAESVETGEASAIKEYLPAQLAIRAADGWLEPSSPSNADTFTAGLRGFLDEARLLARVKHPGLVAVLEAWEQHGTAYMAMPLYEGPTLERVIGDHPAGLSVDALRAIAAPLLGALAAIHAAGHVHRDVSPDNVIVRPDAGAVLLDLGAARRVIGDRVRAMTVMLKAGYAPIEQYADDPDCPIGPWSDVYALAAVLHHAALGESPPPSPLRVMRDTRVPLAARAPEGMATEFAEAIDAAMAVRPEDRPQSATAFRARLGLDDEPPGLARIEPAPAEPAWAGAVRRRPSVGPLILAASMLVVFAISVTVWIRAVPVPVNPDPVTEAVPSAPVAAAPGLPTRTMSANGSVPSDAGLGRSTARPAATLPATVKLSVVPWAEVWVDGVKRGVSPPLTSVTLMPGAHQIELRNPAAGAHVRRVEVKAGQSMSITHRFDAVPAQ